jgi:hypothetical protein
VLVKERGGGRGRRREAEAVVVGTWLGKKKVKLPPLFWMTPLGGPPDLKGCPRFSVRWADPNGPNRTDSDTKMGSVGDALREPVMRDGIHVRLCSDA